MPVVRDSRVIASEVGDEFILVSPDMVFFSLNQTARFVWDLLDGSQDVDDLTACAVAEFDVESARAKRSISAVIQAMSERGLALPAEQTQEA